MVRHLATARCLVLASFCRNYCKDLIVLELAKQLSVISGQFRFLCQIAQTMKVLQIYTISVTGKEYRPER